MANGSELCMKNVSCCQLYGIVLVNNMKNIYGALL